MTLSLIKNIHLTHTSIFSFSGGKRVPKLYAFTLVELIVVVTIIAILGTVGFISYSNYLTTARDSNRISQLTRISDALQAHTTTHSLPLPDNAVTITDGASTISYQGDLGESVLQTIDYSTTARDPKDNTPFTYFLSADRMNFQLLAFMEEQKSLQSNTHNSLTPPNILSTQSYANLYTNRYPKTYGGQLGVITRASDNAPLQTFTTGSFEMRTASELMTLHFSDNSSITAEGYGLYGLGITRLGARGNISCPEGFVPVPGNPEFNTQAFCVAQYEMSYSDADIPNSTFGGVDWNTVAYEVGKPIVSMAGKYPITNITQQQAIDACKSMGSGYHLITNNQWMTIARNIESTVGDGIIYNGVSNNTTLGCDGTGGNTEPRAWATRTGAGSDTVCNTRRQHKLSNGSIIWDMAGNVWEHVNKANNTSGIGFNSGQTSVAGSSAPTAWDDNGIYTPADMQRYGSALGLGRDLGRGNIYYAQGVTHNILRRGAAAAIGTAAGLFALALEHSESNQTAAIGFRCAR